MEPTNAGTSTILPGLGRDTRAKRECHSESAVTWPDALQLFLRKRLADFVTTFDVTAAAYAA